MESTQALAQLTLSLNAWMLIRYFVLIRSCVNDLLLSCRRLVFMIEVRHALSFLEEQKIFLEKRRKIHILYFLIHFQGERAFVKYFKEG